jgi:hypothetical protein
MTLSTTITTFLQQRRQRRARARVAAQDVGPSVHRAQGQPMTRDVAIGGQTGSTVA